MAKSPDVSVDLVRHVAAVRIDRAPNNYFDADLIDALADAFEGLARGTDCRAIVLCSAGKHFCAGADFRGGDRRPTYDGRGSHTYDQAQRLFEQPLPVVAAVQGGAVGGGLGLALAADFRVGSERAWFSANFSAIGFHHGFALTETLPDAIGRQQALELLLTGRRVKAEEAHEMGLLDRVTDGENLEAEAHELASEIAGSAPLAVRAIRATMRQGLAERVRVAMRHEKDQQQWLSRTQDWAEGVRAAAEKRSPFFVGR